jgi:hypothetical protein
MVDVTFSAFYDGIGIQTPLVGAEFGIGVSFGLDGVSLDFEGYAYAGGESGIYGGDGFWGGLTSKGLGGGKLLLTGYNFGDFSIEAFMDNDTGQLFLGLAEGEGEVVGAGIYLSAPPGFKMPPGIF